MTQIEIGVKYTPAHPDWDRVIADLREGDEVEIWLGAREGHRGALHYGKVNGFRGIKLAGIYVRFNDGIDSRLTELTVTALAPRRPDWWGAKVIRDAFHDYLIYNIQNDYYISAYGPSSPIDPDKTFSVVIDADGNLTWGAVEAEFTERIYDGIRDGLANARTLLIGEIPSNVMTGIRDACRGDNK